MIENVEEVANIFIIFFVNMVPNMGLTHNPNFSAIQTHLTIL